LNFSDKVFTVGGQGFNMTEFENYIGSNSNDTVLGASYGETIDLGVGNDYTHGQGGDDFIYTGPGADFMAGGAGYDTMVFHKLMVADWQSGVLDPDIASDIWSSWEAIQGSSGDDRIRTNSWGYSVELRGGAGNDVLATGVTGIVSDTLKGEDGNDELNGGAGADSMIGGKGNDAYYVDNIGDVVTENSGEGYDTVNASISYTLGANLEKLVLTGSGNLNGNGNTLNNQLTGNAGNNILSGGVGNDTLSGLAGNDTLNGSTGNDSLYGAAGIDQINGGLGTDKLSSGGGSDKFIFQFGQSLVAAPDRITDFAIGFDKIDLLTQTGIAMGHPAAFFRSSDNNLATTFSQLVNQVFADDNGALAGNQALSVNQAAFVLSTNGAIAGSYLIVNDSVAGFQASTDLVINITGQTGSLPTFGAAPVDTFFV
ncbi:MAG: calcium-binding protein, partial [Nitrosomonas sp.]|nr:calcium-binding protein [Nitrosomonas sp.]